MTTQPSRPPLRVAYQGGPGCNSERAGLSLLHDAFFGWPFASFAQAAATLASGQADLAILPVHNTCTGDIAPALRSIRLWKLVTLEEITLRIEHWLMAAPGRRMASLREVLAHPQVIAQCGRWVASCGLDVQPVDDGARQVARAVRFRSGAAILGPKGIGEATGLYCLQGPLQDDPENRTRFALLARADGRVEHIKQQLARTGA